MPNLTIAHYRITGELGRGGMGIVYRAEDTKLDRTVALKVLPPHALSSEDDRTRFYREARAAAKLNHAHICHVYQVDEAVLLEEGAAPAVDADRRPFIAMEYVDGESLADRIAKGPLKLDEAIRIAGEIADALGAAHEAGIVHRDVKSGNVMLTAKGEAKVLDFGLAKTAASTQLTRQGSTLGTVAYMSPEQARGEDVDRRTDLWALGVVLYEMVAGRLPFQADYEQAALYGILNEDPEPLTAVRTGVPMELEAVVSKLLRKDARHRYQSAAGLIADLGSMRQTQSAVRSTVMSAVREPEPAPPDRTRNAFAHVTTALVAVIALAVGFAASLLVLSEPESEPEPTLSLRLPLRNDQRPLAVQLHPDNRHVVVSTGDSANTTPQIVVVDMQTGVQRPISGTRGALDFDISPDGEWILFGTDFFLAMVPYAGGEPTRLVDSQQVAAVSWGPDGSMLYTAGLTTFRLRDVTSVPEQLVRPDFQGGITGYFIPEWIDDTPYVLLSRQRGPNINNTDSLDLVVLDVTDGTTRTLVESACCGRLLESGHLLYNRGGRLTTGGTQLIVQPFDPDDMTLSGRPVAISGGGAVSQYAVGSNGTFVRVGGDLGGAGTRTIVTVDRETGEEIAQPFETGFHEWIRWSPDGSRIMTQSSPQTASSYVSVFNVAEGTGQRLSVTALDMYSPAWSPDGTRAVAALPAGGTGVNGDLFTFSADGSGGIELLLASVETSFNWPDWSPDGRFIVMRGRDQETLAQEIWRVDLESGEGRVLRQDAGLDRFPRVSPDSRLIAYDKLQDGTSSVWVMTADGSNRWPVAEDASFPTWSPDGRTIYFKRRNTILGVPVSATDGFRTIGAAQLVFETSHDFYYDLSPDGGTFALAATLGEVGSDSHELEVIVNWSALLPGPE